MKGSIFCVLFPDIIVIIHIKEDGMEMVCSRRGRGDNFIQSVCLDDLKGRGFLGHKGIHERLLQLWACVKNSVNVQNILNC
jgi:hypothetical protein